MARYDIAWPHVDRGFDWDFFKVILPMDTDGYVIRFDILDTPGATEPLLRLTEGAGITILEVLSEVIDGTPTVSTKLSLTINQEQSAELSAGIRHGLLYTVDHTPWLSGPIAVKEA